MLKKIGLGLLGACVACLAIGLILFPTQKRLLIDIDSMAKAIPWLVLGYLFGQAGLLVFMTGLTQESLADIRRSLEALRTDEVQGPLMEKMILEPDEASEQKLSGGNAR